MRLKPTSLTLPCRRNRHGESGIALITTLLLLMLMSGMVVAMVMAFNSDMLINGYQGNYRGGFYAADAGLAIVRQSISNGLINTIPPTSDPSSPPIAPLAENAVLTAIASAYGSSYTTINTGQPSSWPATFEFDRSKSWVTAQPCVLAPKDPAATCATPCPSGCTTFGTTPTLYTYSYNYHLIVYGRASGLQQKTTLEESGNLLINVPLTSSPTTPAAFAAWGMFIGNADPICPSDTSSLIAGTISGPVFTNGGWTFGSGSNYIFTDKVGSANPKAGFRRSDGRCDQLTTGTDRNASSTISYQLTGQPKWGQTAIPLPGNDFNQQSAVLDGVGTAGQPSSSDKTKALKSINEAAYPSSTPSTGVFLPYSVDPSPPHGATFTGGGILVEGDAGVNLSIGGTLLSPTQVYTITQGSVVTVITVNNTTNTTLFHDGIHSDVSIAGVPSQRAAGAPLGVAGTPLSQSTMLYVNGAITSLRGPGEGVPAIKDNTALTITAAKSVTITGDILYASEPVTTTSNQIPLIIPNAPVDTLIPGNDKHQSLGIFTAGGDIQLKNSQSSTNLEVDASLAAISQTGGYGLVNTGNNLGTFTIVGGRIQNALKPVNASTRNVYFDKRYASGSSAPPWFPSTTIPDDPIDTPGTPTPIFTRLQWVNQTSY